MMLPNSIQFKIEETDF